MTERSYLFNVLLGLDHFGNSVLGGSPFESISSRVGRNAIAGKPWALVAEKVINTIFFWRPNHCRSAIGS